MAVESFWRVARRPKWIGALLAALALAAIFALLSQWQLNRSFRTVGHTKAEQQAVVELSSLLKPGQAFPEYADGRAVKFMGGPDAGKAVVVGNRVQDGKTGYWLVLSWFSDDDSAGLPLATAWFEHKNDALSAASDYSKLAFAASIAQTQGTLIAPEAPQGSDSGEKFVLKSLSTAQLVNLFHPNQPVPFLAGAVIVNDYRSVFGGEFVSAHHGQTIKVGSQQQFVELNFLNIFYAIEWVVFAGFAVFMWWRLVQDERLGLRDEPLAPAKPSASKGKLDE